MNGENGKRFGWTLGALLLGGLGLRLAYVALQTRTDPWFLHPAGGDPADTLNWARELLSGEGVREGAFYGPPLYPYLVSLFLRVFGENFGLLYYIQHLLMVGTAGLLALVGRRTGGDLAGIATAVLFLFYGPNLFFASRPVAEPLAIFLLALTLWSFTHRTRWSGALAGGLAGLASVARPSLLPLAPLWAAGWARREPWRGAVLVLAMLLVLLPTTWRNYRVSGHLVPVSSNAGLTLYHGNGPGATGYFSAPRELVEGGKAEQRRSATRIAGLRTGQALDDVEADRWWGRQAVSARLADPLGSVGLAFWRAALTLGNDELALDMGPRQDLNPMRRAAPLPLALIVGLAVAGVALLGWRRSGGWPVWGAVLACAVTPLAFYVTSRYRLPMVAMLCLPAGIGLAALVRPQAGVGPRRIGLVALVLAAAGSLLVPTGELLAQSDAGGLRQRAHAWIQIDRLPEAEADLRASIARDGGSAHAWYLLGEVYARMERVADAENGYRRALAIQPGYAPAVCMLGEVLRRQGRDEEALPVLRQGLDSNAVGAACWTHLVGALIGLGRLDEATEEAQRASESGVVLHPQVVEVLRRAQPRNAGEIGGTDE
jgi:tetratricopeptide (TPR) repeat protein